MQRDTFFQNSLLIIVAWATFPFFVLVCLHPSQVSLQHISFSWLLLASRLCKVRNAEANLVTPGLTISLFFIGPHQGQCSMMCIKKNSHFFGFGYCRTKMLQLSNRFYHQVDGVSCTWGPKYLGSFLFQHHLCSHVVWSIIRDYLHNIFSTYKIQQVTNSASNKLGKQWMRASLRWFIPSSSMHSST